MVRLSSFLGTPRAVKYWCNFLRLVLRQYELVSIWSKVTVPLVPSGRSSASFTATINLICYTPIELMLIRNKLLPQL